jgi:two-component system chemotaxis sensor kinase CheA
MRKKMPLPVSISDRIAPDSQKPLVSGSFSGNKHVNSIETDNTELAVPSETIAMLIERAASAVMSADDVDDLAALAAAHTCFQQIATDTAKLAEASVPENFGPTSLAACRLVEQIMLRELENPESALRSLGETVRELQSLINRSEKSTGNAANAAAPVTPAGAQAAPVHLTAAVYALNESDKPLQADDLPHAMEFISEANAHIETAEAALLKLEETPGDPEAVNGIFRSFHTVKGVAGFLNFKQIGALAHGAENLLDLARKGKLEIAGHVVDVVLESIDLLKSLLVQLETSLKAVQPIAPEPRLPGLLDRLHAAATGNVPNVRLSAAASQAAPVVGDATSGPAPHARTTPAQPANAKASDTSHGDGTVKVSTERLDSLINMVGELVISQSMVSQDVTAVAAGNHKVIRNLSHLGKITRELQDLSMSMRMVPIQGVFQKMARVVRDTSHKAGKEVDFVVVGGETELDRNVVEAIGDPLVHMVRNSVDHGVETPEQRLEAGKSRAGRLELRARHQGGQIVIEIADDGRGLNTPRILKKAVEAGIVKEGETLTEQQIFQLIFHAGLSTAEKITDISGRGVGMDVVRRNVEALRGRIDIRSVAGQGTTFSINLPLTMAVIDGMVVRVGKERYIIPIPSIEQSIRPKAEQLSTVHEHGEMCMVRDRLLPLVRLHRLFNAKPRTEKPEEALVVIVHDNDRACCLLVDELVGQQQVVIKSLGESIGTVTGVSGGAILGDGSISLILDVPGLIGLAEGRQDATKL